MNIEQAINKFKATDKWASYSEQTQRQYSYLMDNSLDIVIGSQYLRDMSISSFDQSVASALYHLTSERGVTVANQTKTAFSAMCIEVVGTSPFKGARLLPAGKHTVTTDHMRTFLQAAYSKFKWRNAGLLVHLVYELGQNLNDLLEIKFSDIDYKDQVITVRGIALSLTDDMVQMLRDQEKDFGFQEYVAPNPHISSAGYTPYGQTQISRTIKKIREYAKMPSDFNMAEVRRLGFRAMLQDGYTKEELAIVANEVVDKEFSRTLDRLQKDLTAV